MAMILLELLSEEIPARLQAGARRRLVEGLQREFTQQKIEAKGFTAYSTPRRLAVLVDWVAAASAPATRERRGPRTSAPPQALEGFLRSTGKSRDDLEVRVVKGAEYFFSVDHVPGQPAFETLPVAISAAIAGLTWPKSMRWGSGSDQWVRPLKSILCLYVLDGRTVTLPVAYAGITASSTTPGHGILAPDPVIIESPGTYRESLRQRAVLVDQDERRQAILDGARACVAREGLELVADEELLDEITGLVEWPGVMIGPIDSAYLDLPPTIIRTAMRAHQRYLAATRPACREISHFLAVANRGIDGNDVILAGNQRVLNARLADAKFFFANDRTVCRDRGLDGFVDRLDRTIYHRQIGTQLQRTDRIEVIAESLAPLLNLAAADVAITARYAKADLVSEIVMEFPELQGVMGGQLARDAGLSETIAEAIAEHYQPIGPEDRVPANPLARIVGIADRINHLVGMFGAGEQVSGSRDPLALRRAAVGLVRILHDGRIDIDLAELIQTTLATHDAQGIALPAVKSGVPDGFPDSLLAFLADRFLTHAVASGARSSVVRACIAASPTNFSRACAVIDTLTVFLASDLAADLLHVHRRAHRLAGAADSATGTAVSPELLTAPHEKALWQQITTLAGKREALLADGKIGAVFGMMADLRPALDAFFDNVLVNAEAADIRANRLALLANVLHIPQGLADLSRLESEH